MQQNIPPVILMVAMDKEFSAIAPYTELLQQKEDSPFAIYEALISQRRVVIALSGIGKANAAMATAEAIRLYPHSLCIVNVGVSGGLLPNCSVGDCLVGSKFMYHDVWCGEGNALGQVQGLPVFFSAHEALLSVAHQLSSVSNDTVKFGSFCCGDTFIPSPSVLNNFSDCCAVDMESAAIAQACHLYQKPMIALRIVSDTPLTAQNHSEQYRLFWSNNPHKAFAPLVEFLKLLPIEL